MSPRPEKYRSWTAYAWAWTTRFVLRTMLRTTVSWAPMKDPVPGDSVVIGVPWEIWDLVDIPLLSLQRAKRDRCAEVIVALDVDRAEFDRRYGRGALDERLARFQDLKPGCCSTVRGSDSYRA